MTRQASMPALPVAETAKVNSLRVRNTVRRAKLLCIWATPGRRERCCRWMRAKSSVSSAMIFSTHNKKALLEQIPDLIIFDNVGSSESSASAMAMFGKDNDLEGNAAVIVVLDANGTVLAQRPTIVGGSR